MMASTNSQPLRQQSRPLIRSEAASEAYTGSKNHSGAASISTAASFAGLSPLFLHA